MTRHRTEFSRGEGAGYVFGGLRVEKIKKRMAAVATVNSARIPCATCGLLILPTGMQRHIDIVHSDEETTS